MSYCLHSTPEIHTILKLKQTEKKEISIEMKETLLEHNSQVSLRGCSIGDVEILNTNYYALIFYNVFNHNPIWRYENFE